MDITFISNSTIVLTALDGISSVRTYLSDNLGIFTLVPNIFVIGFAGILKLIANKVNPTYD